MEAIEFLVPQAGLGGLMAALAALMKILRGRSIGQPLGSARAWDFLSGAMLCGLITGMMTGAVVRWPPELRYSGVIATSVIAGLTWPKVVETLETKDGIVTDTFMFCAQGVARMATKVFSMAKKVFSNKHKPVRDKDTNADGRRNGRMNGDGDSTPSGTHDDTNPASPRSQQ